ncbi:fungal-specific transcription factor domain-containing protein [Aspergillus crustosus]
MPTQRSSNKRSSAAKGADRYILPDPVAPPPEPKRRAVVKSYQRSRSGCFVCRLRRKKCDEERPACKSCSKYGLRCEYKTPSWWATTELQSRQRERIRERIRQHRVMEKEGSLKDYMARIKSMCRRVPARFSPEPETTHPVSAGSSTASSSNVNPYVEPYAEPYVVEPYTEPLPTPVTASSTTPITPFNYEIKANSEVMWPTMPVAEPYSATAPTFNTFNPLQPQVPTPELANDEWYNPMVTPTTATTFYPSQTQQLLQQPYSSVNPYAAGYGAQQPALPSSRIEFMIPINEADRPLLNHFVDSVIPLVFPISEALQSGPGRFHDILTSIKTNRSYMHCCLSVSATHLKTVRRMEDEMDFDIVKHHYEAVCQLSKALDRSSSNKAEIMDASLALIYYHCSVGAADDYLFSIPWQENFTLVSELVKKLHSAPSKLNVSLIAWIDILGSTMLGKTPEFSHTYRTKHLRGVSSDLQTLMGCDDRIMYLISEIACLESLKNEKSIDDITVGHHINLLTAQLDWTEPLDPSLEAPFTPTGVVRPDMLIKIVSTLFRLAARIYLYSLLPTFNPYDPLIANLVTSVTDTLQYIPAGAHGFDRALIWPLFIAGAHSVPSSHFRRTMTERVAALKHLGEIGSFGRMYRVLKAVWRVADSSPSSPTTPTAPGPSFSLEQTQVGTPESLPHWRDVMKQNKWDYLLM